MSVVSIRAALETALAAMSPELETANENVTYVPPATNPPTPYQILALLLARPRNDEISASHVEQGFLQVTLRYPVNAGSGAAAARAEAIRTAFYRGRGLTAGGITVTITDTPEIMPAYVDADRFCVPVRIRFRAPVTA